MMLRRSDDMPDKGNGERLRKLQIAFAGHIRDPEKQDAPAGVEDRRMRVYRELFFNNIKSLLASNFPVIRTLYDDDGWQRLVREFYAEHRSQTPLFPEIAKEFLRYLQDIRKPRESDPAFLHELAHYEWVELALALDDRELDSIAADRDGDLLAGVPLLSPLAWPLTYRYPVHRIRPDYQPAEPPEQATHLLVYRNRRDEVKFMRLNELARLLLALMQQEPGATGLELLQRTAREIRHPDPETIIDAGAELLRDLRSRDVLLGTRSR
jgi:hypothetical protein